MPNKGRNLILLAVFAVVLIVIIPVVLWAFWSIWGGGYYMHGMMGYGWWLMPLIPVLFLLLLVLGAYFFLKEFMSEERSVPSQRALELLKERYARGELTREEYLKMKEDLES
jgi:putative membrane protein